MKLSTRFLAAGALVLAFANVVHAQVLAPNRGGTGTSTTPSAGQVLIGNGQGGYTFVASSTLGSGDSLATTSPFAESDLLQVVDGSTVRSIATSSLGLPTFEDVGAFLANYLSLSAWFATTTDALDEGENNLYFTNVRARGALSETLAGIDYSTSTGVFSLASGYTIPLTASTTDWQTAFSWGNHALAGYLTEIATSTVRGMFSAASPLTYSTSTGEFGFSNPGYLLGVDWGDITGTIADQTDLQASLDAKLSTTSAAATYYLQSNPAGYITSAALAPYLTTSTAAATYLTQASATATYLPLAGGTVTGALTVQGTTTLGTTTLSNLSETILAVDENGQIVGTTTSGGISAPMTTTDRAIATWNGTDGTALRNTALVINSNDEMVFPNNKRAMFFNTAGTQSTGQIYADTSNNFQINTESMVFPVQINGSYIALGNNTGNVGVGVVSPSNKLHVLSATTPQFRVAYDSSNYFTASVSSAGAVTLDATGASQGFTLSDSLTVNGTTTLATTAASQFAISGALFDGVATSGSNGMVLQTTGTSTRWVATSTLGLGGGGGGTVTSVAASVPTGLVVTGSPITTSGTLAFDWDEGYAAVLMASTSNWESFYTTPSGRITAGDGLTWSGNTLNFDGGDAPGGQLGGTWASPTIDDLFLLNTGDTGVGSYSFSGGTFSVAGTSTLATTTMTLASSSAFFGAGLTDCDNASNSKLLWSDTGLFSCGTDQTGGGGGVLASSTATYVVYPSGGNYVAYNAITGTTSSNASFTTLLQGLVSSINGTTTGGVIHLKAGDYANTGATTILGNDQGSYNNAGKITIEGEGPDATRILVAPNAGFLDFDDAAIVGIKNFSVYVTGTSTPFFADSNENNARAMWLSEFENIHVAATTTHTGWAFDLGNTFRSTFRNIEMFETGNCMRFRAEGTFNPGDLVLSRAFCELSTNANGISYGFSQASTGFMNQVHFEMVEGIAQGTGQDFIDGVGLSYSEFYGLNAEQYDTLVDLSGGSSNYFNFNYATHRDSTAGLKGCRFMASSYANRCDFKFLNTTANFVAVEDADDWGDTPNIFSAYIGADAGTTTASTTGLTLFRDIRGYGNLDTNLAPGGRFGRWDFFGDLVARASAATVNFASALWTRITVGTAPTVAVNGDIGIDTTDNQFKFYSGGVKVLPSTQKLWGATIASTSADFVSGGRIPLPVLRDGATVTEIHCFVDGGTSVVINYDTMAGGANSDTVTCGTTKTSDTSITSNPTLSSSGIYALEIGTITGSPDYVTFSIWGTWTEE